MKKKLVLKIIIFVIFVFQDSFAIEIHQDSLKDFIKNSKQNPKQNFVITFGANWCGPCKGLKSTLKSWDKDSALKRSYWNYFGDKNIFDNKKVKNFMKNYGLPPLNGVPQTYVFKNGVPIGSYSGYKGEGSGKDINLFLEEAELVESPTSHNENTEILEIPKFKCQRNDEDVCVVGVSGYDSFGVTKTDNFGRANLLTYARLFSDKKYIGLFAPPIKSDHTEKTSKKSTGVFFVKNPFLKFKNKFTDAQISLNAFNSLGRIQSDNIRILITGHGGPGGVTTNYKTNGSETNELVLDTAQLTDDDVKDGVVAAVKKKKSVKALIVQCYGGQYAESFMAALGKDEKALACASFATLPEKLSEGCYSVDYGGKRNDYLFKATKYKSCDINKTARDAHYKIVTDLTGHDIPMLTSEYFLTHGPAAEYLTKQSKAFLPDGAFTKKVLPSGIEIFENTSSIFVCGKNTYRKIHQ